MDVKISIIIPVYNVAPYLDACLSSCINQTFRDIEIIVVNDGSPDTSYQIIAAYAAMDERIVVVNKKNEGLIYARKSGLDIARGEYVFHLDGDDYIENNTMEVLYKEAIEKSSDYVLTGNFYILGNQKSECPVENEAIGLSGQDLLLFLIFNLRWQIWGRLIKKSLFNGIIYRQIFMGEDLYFNMQIALKVKRSTKVDACLYNYIRRDGSITAKNDERAFRYTLEMIESIWFLLDREHYNQQVKESIYRFWDGYLIDSIKKNRIEVKSILRNYYWRRKEERTSLWKGNKVLYFVCIGYLYVPRITVIGINLGSKLKALIRSLV